MHAFGAFSPFGATWRPIGHWDFGDKCKEERLFSLRFDVSSQLRAAGPHTPVEYPLRELATASSQGHLRLLVSASRRDGRSLTEFFCDASGVDIYADHVHVELWAPEAMGSARGDSQASQGASLGVLDEVFAPSVTRIGSALRGTATLHTYAQAAEPHPVPPCAIRYAVLSGEQPDFLISGATVAAGAPASGAVGGVTGLRLTADSVIAWEVAP